MELLLIYLLVGVGAGLIAGLLGLGGGVVIVPALAVVFAARPEIAPELVMHLAIGTSLAAIVPTAVSSTWAHHRHGAIRWEIFRAMAAALAVGALLGAAVADHLPGAWLARIFGAFIIAVGVQIFLGARAPGHRDLPGRGGLLAAGGIIGAASAILGIGGGSLTVPFLNYCRVEVKQAVATSAACGLVLGALGAIGFLLTGQDHPQLPAWSTGYIYWPAAAGIVLASVTCAPLGARLAHRLPTLVLKRIFALFLIANGARMLVG